MIPAGFNAKIIKPREAWLGNSSVTQILSVSGCISKDAVDFTTTLRLGNQWLLYNSDEALDEAIAGESVDASRLRRFFYDMHDQEFDEGKWVQLKDMPTQVVKPKGGYSLKGFDVVCFSAGADPECSPLSCNALAETIEVNQFCLLETSEYALRVAQEIDHDGEYEPGPYRVMSVWEKEADRGNGGNEGGNV